MGRLLAWLSRDQTSLAHIVGVQGDGGLLLTDPEQINTRFASYYQQLYTSRAHYSMDQLDQYLTRLDFPNLNNDARRRLGIPITLEEIKRALTSMPAGKTPGVDGLLAEFYKTHADLLLPRLYEMFRMALADNQLPPLHVRGGHCCGPQAWEGPDPLLLLLPNLTS